MFRIKLDTADTRRALLAAGQAIGVEMPQLMEILGVQVLSEAQLAYTSKARGSVGSDGVAWPKLARATLEARVRRVGRGRTIVAKRKKLAEQIRSTKGKGATAKVVKLRKQRADLKADLEKLVDAAVANHEIGVDTGLQRASAKPGFRPPAGGGNVLEVNGNEVTVGYGRNYSTYFDERRKLLPETLPAAWATELDRRAEEWAGGVIRRYFDR